jgi:hypothetical protein
MSNLIFPLFALGLSPGMERKSLMLGDASDFHRMEK